MSGHHLCTGGHAADVRTFAQRVEAIGETLGDVPLQVAAQYYLVMACYIVGRLSRDRTPLPETDAVAPRRSDP